MTQETLKTALDLQNKIKSCDDKIKSLDDNKRIIRGSIINTSRIFFENNASINMCLNKDVLIAELYKQLYVQKNLLRKYNLEFNNL